MFFPINSTKSKCSIKKVTFAFNIRFQGNLQPHKRQPTVFPFFLLPTPSLFSSKRNASLGIFYSLGKRAFRQLHVLRQQTLSCHPKAIWDFFLRRVGNIYLQNHFESIEQWILFSTGSFVISIIFKKSRISIGLSCKDQVM